MEKKDYQSLAVRDEEYIKGLLGTCNREPSSECCIYRVPDSLRKLNEDAYTPRVVSIGPIHHGSYAFRTMEMYKGKCLKDFLERTNKSLRDFINYVVECEEQVLSCYAETFMVDNFRAMLVMDGIFILEFLLRWDSSSLGGVNDNPSYNPLDIGYDLRLLENQLPFFLVKGLYDLAFPERLDYLHTLVSRQFGNFDKNRTPEIKHFTDLQRILKLPKPSSPPPVLLSVKKEAQCSKSVTALREAGVKFQLSSSECLFDIKFDNGVLTIPCLKIGSITESFFRNLMAFEQCHHPFESYICHYIFLMDSLINTAKDVDLLVKKRIIVNWLGDSDAVATLINKLCKHISVFGYDFYFHPLCEDLDAHCKRRWYGWKTDLKHNYLSTPWKIASTTAAIILIGLTLIQTLCSIYSVVKQK